MHIPDLCTSSLVADGPEVRAIGWLDPEHPFPVGDVAPDVLAALRAHVRDAWLPVTSMGCHPCPFCYPTTGIGDRREFVGTQYVIIPSVETVFIAPDLLPHYIHLHRYCPPSAFLDAVVACPPQQSSEFLFSMKPFLHLWDMQVLPDGSLGCTARR